MIPLLIGLSLAAPVPKDAAGDQVFRRRVDAARDEAVAYLRKEQDANGGWESSLGPAFTGFKGGSTGLVTLALLEAGVRPDDPDVAKAVEYLLALKSEKTYVVSLQTQVLARANAKAHANAIQANADWLAITPFLTGGKLRGWGYGHEARIADGSNTHFAVMGLHTAARAGAKVDADIWRKVREYYAEAQLKDGGWPYWSEGDTDTSTSMTVCALLGLAVATKYDKDAKGPDPAFEQGMAALLGKHTLGDGMSAFVSWMAVAELGGALDTAEFKSGKLAKPWYREGGEKLLKLQQKDGSFRSGDDNGGTVGVDKHPVLATACALYFFGPPARK